MPVSFGSPINDDLPSLMAEKLQSSGIPASAVDALGLYTISREEAAKRGHWGRYGGRPGLVFPYFDPETNRPSRFRTGWPEFYRVRDIAPEGPPKKDDLYAKYLSPSNAGLVAYYPRLPNLDWKTAISDPEIPLFITEGELKAIAAGLKGRYVIGLGGVDSFVTSHRSGVKTDFLPDLERIVFPRRRVYIVYDSDIKGNPHIVRAAKRLAERLLERGALTYITILPGDADRGEKLGLDDYLLKFGDDSFEDIVSTSPEITEARTLFELNDRYALIHGTNEVIDKLRNERMKIENLVIAETKSTYVSRLTATGDIAIDRVNAAKAWIDWPLRDSVSRVVFEPAKPKLIETTTGFEFNTFPGIKVEASTGDVAPFMELIDHLFEGATWEKEWFLNWLAYPMKNLGTKMFTAVVMHGLVHGSGKTLVAETMARIYGPLYTKIGQNELKGNFNEWAAKKLFILGDDITGLSKHEIHDAIKVMISQTTIRINPKGLTAYELGDYANFFFTSNRANAFYIDDGDRRFFVWEVPERVGKKSREFYRNYMKWLDADGPAALLDYFLKRDVGAFDPGDAAPATGAKAKMTSEARNAETNWAHDLRSNPDELLVGAGGIPMKGDLFTLHELIAAYRIYTDIEVTSESTDNHLRQRLPHSLTEAGFYVVTGKLIGAGRGVPKAAKYYAIRNLELWRDASVDTIRAHLEAVRGPVKAKRF